jgi:hypothetical protein
VVDTAAAGGLIAELHREIDGLRHTVARLRGSGADRVPVRRPG